MKPRPVNSHVSWLGAVDWDRRLFDALIPLPDGTSYNAYLIQGSEKTVLVDAVDPTMVQVLMAQMEDVAQIDYVVSNHAEQDHSGALPQVLAKYPQARVLTTFRARPVLESHLGLPPASIIEVEDGETLSLGGRTLEFIHAPWVHWPETMFTYLREDRILFRCDFFGSHLATTDLFAVDQAPVYEAAKRYYAEIMMPFRPIIGKHLQKVRQLEPVMIAPSHGPVYHNPRFIIEAYEDWASDGVKNLVVLPYISMHGSTRRMVEVLVSALAERGVGVQTFDLTVTDIGKLAVALVDAATIVIGTPTVLGEPHPVVMHAAHLANVLHPKARFASVIGSFGWKSNAVRGIAERISRLKVEILEPVLCKGFPQEADLAALARLADDITARHRELGLV